MYHHCLQAYINKKTKNQNYIIYYIPIIVNMSREKIVCILYMHFSLIIKI